MKRRSILILATFAMVAAACSPDSGGGTTTTPAGGSTTEGPATTTTSPATTTTTPATTTTSGGPSGVIPDLNVGVSLQPYADEDVTAGQVVVYWYRGTAEKYIAVYTGQGIAEPASVPLCPGNSIEINGQFSDITNTPPTPESCEGFPTPPASIQACSSGVWLYETAIFTDLIGNLYASLEWNSESGGIKGLTSVAETNEEMPEFEYGLDSYAIAPWMTSDGTTVIQCEAPTP